MEQLIFNHLMKIFKEWRKCLEMEVILKLIIDYSELEHQLISIKTRLEQRIETIQYQDLKYFYKSLLPFLIKVLEVLLSKENERVILSIKTAIMDIFAKVLSDDILVEHFIQILNL